MTATQSRLLIQLIKQEAKPVQNRPIQKKLQDLYQITCKQESNNLKLVEFLILSIQKKLLTNTHGLKIFSEIFEEFCNKPIESESSSLPNNSSILTGEEEKKFHKQRFLKIWQELAKRTHPGDEGAYEKVYYPKLVGIEVEENRMKVDDTLKKLMTKENLKGLMGYKEAFQQIFTMYSPENYNRKLKFFWNEIKLLNRKLPIICCLRFLADCEVCPNILSFNGFFEIVSKLLPASNSNHKQTLFYNSETINAYTRDHSGSQKIKLLEGDIGMLFHEFQLIMMRIAIQVNKQLAQKGDLGLVFKKLFEDSIGLGSSLSKHSTGARSTKFTQLKQDHNQLLEADRFPGYQSSVHQDNLLQLQNQPKLNPYYQSDLEDLKVRKSMSDIKQMLDQELPKAPQIINVLKENEGVYDMNQKCVVIGEQPPKIVEKVRAMPRENKKPVDELLGQKPEILTPKEQSNGYFKQLLNPSTKTMKNNTFYPILLSQTVSPKQLVQNSQLYVETCFINLYEHNYKEAKQHLHKAKDIQKTLSIQNKIFFLYVEGQINEAIGEDQEALDLYFKCLDLIHVTKENISDSLKALPYCGIGSCLYHASEFEYSLRCFLKAKEFREDKLTSDTEEYADLLNNLGCCFLKLERASEARKSFEESYKILDDRLGVYHEKTLVVLQNLNKSKKCFVERIPEYKSMWKTFSRKAGLPAPKKKK